MYTPDNSLKTVSGGSFSFVDHWAEINEGAATLGFTYDRQVLRHRTRLDARTFQPAGYRDHRVGKRSVQHLG